jgi:5-methylcytosine-specific restriction enzyme A
MGQFHHLYNTTRWRRKRAIHLLVEPLCRMCLPRPVPGTVADHVEPHNGDPAKFWAGELQTLCSTHHSSTKQRQEKRGRTQGCDAQGNPIAGWQA